MSAMVSGRSVRLGRILGESRRVIIVPMDHSVSKGPIAGLEDPRSSERMAALRPNALILPLGVARRLKTLPPTVGLIIHASASIDMSNVPRPQKSISANVGSALRLGADGISVHVNLGAGAAEDKATLSELGRTICSADEFGIPVLTMIYTEPRYDTELPHAARAVADLGSDLVKVTTRSPRTLEQIRETCPVPVLLAGGEHPPDETAKLAVEADIAGICAGRGLFGAHDSDQAILNVRRIID